MMCLGEAWKQAKKIIEGACYEVPSRISLVKGERNVRQGVTSAQCRLREISLNYILTAQFISRS